MSKRPASSQSPIIIHVAILRVLEIATILSASKSERHSIKLCCALNSMSRHEPSTILTLIRQVKQIDASAGADDSFATC